MIETYLRPKLNQFLGYHKEAEIWFEQDGATAHTSRRSLGIQRDLFPGRLLSLRRDIARPPKGSYLIYHLGVFSLGDNNPKALKEAIIQAVAVISPEMTRREL
ncbi:uncharacterized protein TNCV_2198801 [Trichonephila clavipes]|nr:uncharacterized protein TNCV_2198801 [Trichonephila clavipes]